jgi:hypothetical protein
MTEGSPNKGRLAPDRSARTAGKAIDSSRQSRSTGGRVRPSRFRRIPRL